MHRNLLCYAYYDDHNKALFRVQGVHEVDLARGLGMSEQVSSSVAMEVVCKDCRVLPSFP